MNTQETTNEKLPAEKGTAKRGTSTAEIYFANLHGDGKLTRVPVAHLYFPPGEYLDFSAGGSSQLSNIACARPGVVGRAYWVCDFIPAWQAFELSFVPGQDSTPVTEMVGVVHVKRWKRA